MRRPPEWPYALAELMTCWMWVAFVAHYQTLLVSVLGGAGIGWILWLRRRRLRVLRLWEDK